MRIGPLDREALPAPRSVAVASAVARRAPRASVFRAARSAVRKSLSAHSLLLASPDDGKELQQEPRKEGS